MSEQQFEGVEDLVEELFSQPPKPPASIQLEILNTSSNTHDVFRTLGQILTHGLVYLYGPDPSFEQIDLSLVQQYMHSIGWHPVVNPKNPKAHPRALPYQLVISNWRIVFEPYVHDGRTVLVNVVN